MKAFYEKPIMDLSEFATDEVVTTSTGYEDNETQGNIGDNDW